MQGWAVSCPASPVTHTGKAACDPFYFQGISFPSCRNQAQGQHRCLLGFWWQTAACSVPREQTLSWGVKCASPSWEEDAAVQNGLQNVTCPKHSHFHIKDAYMQSEEVPRMNVTLHIYANLTCSCTVETENPKDAIKKGLIFQELGRREHAGGVKLFMDSVVAWALYNSLYWNIKLH